MLSNVRNYLLIPCYAALLFCASSCTYDQVMVVETCDQAISLNLIDNVPSSCGLATGSILAEITNGDPAANVATFSLNGGAVQTVPAFDRLTAGAYTLEAKQGVCTAELDFTIGNAAGLNASVAVTPSGCTVPSGSITVATTDAIGEVSFSLDGGSAQTSSTFTDLSPGEYAITAVDASGCTVTLSATVVSDVDFARVETIVTNSCALSGCHAGNVSPDFRVRENIVARASRISARTSNQSMPPPSSGVTLTSAEINAIACWVADGAPN